MFICMLDARGEKGGSINCGVEGKREEKKKKKAKRNPSLQGPEGWLGEAAAEINALLLLLHGNYSCQKESRLICC